MNKQIGVTDEPVKHDIGEEDKLDINIYSKSLIDFVEGTETPITIGIQGKWGSGKTSLINSIHHNFADKDQEYKQIWVNSWEYSLLSSPEEALVKIIAQIINELTAEFEDSNDNGSSTRSDQIKKNAKKIFKSALKIGAAVAAGTAGTTAVDEVFYDDPNELEEDKGGTIKDLRRLLDESIKRSQFKKVIVYVDDLDRIEPKNAVATLELLKNIFNVKKCVFVLAIDYEVVVKGLREKFGEKTPDNEREFQAFFDKIIQLPFTMPTEQYDIGNYVQALLENIDFIRIEELEEKDQEEFSNFLKAILDSTIGGNPRSIKRLVNSISLVEIFSRNKKKLKGLDDVTEDIEMGEGVEKRLKFSLICLQIAFPGIYSLLTEKPDFLTWDEIFALRQTNGLEERIGDNKDPAQAKKLFDRDLKARSNLKIGAKKSEKKANNQLDWEEALFRICYINPSYKLRFDDIKNFFLKIKGLHENQKKLTLKNCIQKILNDISITSIKTSENTSSSKGEWKSKAEKAKSNKLWSKTIEGLENTHSEVFSKGNATSTSGRLTLKNKKIESKNIRWCLSESKGIYLWLTRDDTDKDKQKSHALMEQIMQEKDKIEKDLGVDLTWQKQDPENTLSHYICLQYKNIASHKSSEGWPKKLDKRNSFDEWLEYSTKFFVEYAPRFEEVLEKHLILIKEGKSDLF